MKIFSSERELNGALHALDTKTTEMMDSIGTHNELLTNPTAPAIATAAQIIKDGVENLSPLIGKIHEQGMKIRKRNVFLGVATSTCIAGVALCLGETNAATAWSLLGIQVSSSLVVGVENLWVRTKVKRALINCADRLTAAGSAAEDRVKKLFTKKTTVTEPSEPLRSAAAQAN